MNKVSIIAKNEIKQQIRRKALWISILCLFVYLVWDNNNVLHTSGYFYQIMSNSKTIGGLLCYIIFALCANRVYVERKTDCFSIIISSSATKYQYYCGKVIGNIVLFGLIGFILNVVTDFFRFIKEKPVFEHSYILYFVIFYFISTLFYIIFGVIFSTSITIFFKNSVISVILCMLYTFLQTVLGFYHPFILYMQPQCATNLYCYFIQFLGQRSNQFIYNANYEKIYYINDVYISITLILSMLVTFFISGMIIFNCEGKKRKLKMLRL